MASIVKKKKKNRSYYYAVESARVEGEPRIVWQKYLGTVDAIVRRAEEAAPPKPKETVVFEAGGVAALLRIAQRLGLVELIDAVIPKREQGPSVGQYMLLAALNRALAPCSKLAIGDWYEETLLRRLWRLPKTAFSSQRFWDHMDRVSEAAIDSVQEQLVARIEEEYGLDRHVLLYDTTNFFTFLATANSRGAIAKRGHSKAKRHDLRQVGLALLVTREGQVPLFHRVYAGNITDVSLFADLAKELLERHDEHAGPDKQATLVFDKGNVCDASMQRFVAPKRHFVAALPANQAPELIAAPLEDFEDVPGLPGTKAYKVNHVFWDQECTAVVAYTESFFTQQWAGVTTNLVKCQKKLMDLEKGLRRWRQGKARGKRPTVRSVKKSAQAILSAQFMKELFEIRVEEENALPQLYYALNHTALARLTRQRLGRTVLVTDHSDWTASQIIAAYRSLTNVEDAFKNMKNIDFLHWQPAYHWTTKKIKVHGFYCVLALLLATLARNAAVQAGIDMSIPALLKELTAIREVAVIYPQGTLAHRKDHLTLSRMTARQKKLADILDIAKVIKG
jgi:transposase